MSPPGRPTAAGVLIVAACVFLVTAPFAAGSSALQEAQQDLDRAEELRAEGRYGEAVPLAERALAAREKLLAPDDIAVADALHLLALLLDDTNDYARAEPLNLRALAIREAALGPEHPDVAESLLNLAWIARSRSDTGRAATLYERALAIQEKAHGPESAEVATVLNDQAMLYDQMGDYARAIAINERVLAIRERTLGPADKGVAKALHNLARVCQRTGDYPRAFDLSERALAIWEKALGPDHPEVAFAVVSLADALSLDGDFTRAEPLYRRALATREKAFGPDHPEVATILNNLAVLYRDKGDSTQARALLLRDLAITEKRLGPEHRFVAPTLINLAGIERLEGNDGKAEPLYRRALSIYEASLGPEHADVGMALSHLGRLCAEADPARTTEAQALLERAHAILEKALGPDHRRVAATVAGLALVATARGDLALAGELLQRALVVTEKSYGPDHPEVAAALERLSDLSRSLDDVPRAIDYLARSQEIRERHLAHNLLPGSERQKAEFLRLFAEDADRAVSLHARLAPEDPRALRLALTTVLRRKGRTLDAMSDSVALLRRNAAPGDRQLFDRLSEARARLAAITLRPPTGPPAAYKAQQARLRDAVERDESDLGARSAAFRAEARPVTLEAVQAALPPGTTLVEYALYRPGAPGARDRPPLRYAAYTLAAAGDPRWTDLGEAGPIGRAIATWRAALRDPKRTDVGRAARAVDALVMQPVRALPGTSDRLLISPDGALNLIPFAALVDEANELLVKRSAISYLTSGRDLLRLTEPRVSRGPAAIVAAPAFGDPPLVASANGPAKRVDDSQIFFGPLPGASQEVRALRTLLPQATILIGQEATEAALRRLQAPAILHIATHGFFLDEGRAPDRDAAATATPPATTPPGTRIGRWSAKAGDPLLRSGLAMAGANQGRSGDDDGVLTALETAGLDLWGTKLVVLSGCDTGVGEVRRGEGVLGLRRALVLAGAESQMMSLWPVSDRSTRDLMIEYYRQLTGGAGRAEALRQAQLRLLHDARRAHPFYWAGFIPSGEWAALDGRR